MSRTEKPVARDPWSLCRAVLEGGLNIWNIKLNTDQWRQFEILFNSLTAWNKATNLTTITDPADIATKHFLDSLSPVLFPAAIPLKIILDLGTGGGFPGIPLKIVCPEMELTLVEKSEKKSAFLHTILGELGLLRVRIISRRIEDLADNSDFKEKFETILVRALAPPDRAIRLALPFMHREGTLVLYTGPSAPRPDLPSGYRAEPLPVQLPQTNIQRTLLTIFRT